MAENGNKARKEGADMFIGGCIVTGIGLLFLLINMDILPPMRYSWPAFLIVVGLALIIGGFFKKSKPHTTE